MLVLITYDVNTQSAAGKKRLRQVAKQCVNYGQRVQNSVFECILDATQCAQVKNKLIKLLMLKKIVSAFIFLEITIKQKPSI